MVIIYLYNTPLSSIPFCISSLPHYIDGEDSSHVYTSINKCKHQNHRNHRNHGKSSNAIACSTIDT